MNSNKCIFYAFVTDFYKITLHVILAIICVTGLGPGGRRKGAGISGGASVLVNAISLP